eukprot:CAMPEP_0204843216 /NCGR_PEP_ID=MMETSP1346-20131115/47849_1 /ASSEMBLY_ACC=CAM_ASM_000771 /TAXON_ID=215587 /ORGANISM="Aplanochytrium stocchinoi, Strain GSBS06" /LENGTH=291 /DNA_ID=CAMNT_0051982323 /DNA_START=96 /DNA_END=968 /DNA_ORIENTATION=-
MSCTTTLRRSTRNPRKPGGSIEEIKGGVSRIDLNGKRSKKAVFSDGTPRRVKVKQKTAAATIPPENDVVDADEGTGENRISEYERLRMQQIKENHMIMSNILGIDEKAKLQTFKSSKENKSYNKVARAAKPKTIKARKQQTRVSRRLRGIKATDGSLPDDYSDVEDEQESEGDEYKCLTPKERKAKWREDMLSSIDLKALPPLPLTLPSEGHATILELGEMISNPGRTWFSSSGCLFHHQYPVGYKARIDQWERSFLMEIRSDPKFSKPIFYVTNEQTGVSKFGDSPTKPW